MDSEGASERVCTRAKTFMQQASNAGEALKRLQEINKAKVCAGAHASKPVGARHHSLKHTRIQKWQVALSKFESYSVKLSKPMGLVSRDFALYSYAFVRMPSFVHWSRENARRHTIT